MGKAERKMRCTVDLDEWQIAALRALKRSTGATTAQIFRNGLRLMELVVKTGKEGGRVEITDSNGNGTRLTFLF